MSGLDEVLRYLKERGHSPEEIESIRKRLAAYDDTVLRDSLFDDLGRGTAFLGLVIAEASALGQKAGPSDWGPLVSSR